jgi:hypothetical protein
MHFADKLIFPGGGLGGAPELPGWSPVTHDRSVIPVLHCVTSVALDCALFLRQSRDATLPVPVISYQIGAEDGHSFGHPGLANRDVA